MALSLDERARVHIFTALTAIILLVLLSVPARSGEAPPSIVQTTIDGAIGVATERQLTQALEHTRDVNGRYLLIQMDTPGGLVTSTRNIIRQMLASEVPIIVYVAPSGARAASAGTFILYASHFAAMAPGTNLGAATPIQLGGSPQPTPSPQPANDDRNTDEQPGNAEQKAINDAIAQLRSLAQLRGRDADFAERAVRNAATLTASEALDQGVIEAVAPDTASLLAQMHGRTIMLGTGSHVLSTRGLTLVMHEPDWQTRLLAVITDPNIAFIMLMVGFYGLLFEFMNPGALVPGVIGAISLLVALTSLSMLPLQYAAIALVVLGIALMVAEVFVSGFGILGLGGIAAVIAGGAFLFDPDGADFNFGVAWPVLVATALTSGALLFASAGAALRSRRRPVVSGSEGLTGSVATVVEWGGVHGRVRVQGEMWAAESGEVLAPGDSVRVTGRRGLTLIVGRT